MIYKDFQNLRLPMLGFGSMRLPLLPGGGDGDVDEAAVAEMVALAMERGANYFDTAYGYHNGNSERVMGRVLSRYPRESWLLASKFPGYDVSNIRPDRVEAIFEEQLEKCGVDYFDFYLFHNVYERNVGPYLDPDNRVLEYLLRQKEAGRIRHLGFSAHGSLAVIQRFLDAYGEYMEFGQLQLNYLDWDFQGARAKAEELNRRHIPIWVMEPLRGGRLARLSDGDAARLAVLGCPLQGAGLDAYVVSNVPGGSGLSSSAAFEVLVGAMLSGLFWPGRCSPVEIAQIGQYAENVYFGKPCGLMDQTASSVGGVVAIDFADPARPQVEQIPLDFAATGHALCILDSGAGHADLTAEYAAITAELGAVCRCFGKEVLREVPEEAFLADLPRVRVAAGDRAVLRAFHCYAENRRAGAQAQALKDGDFDAFLALVRDSGRSSALYLQNVVPTGQTAHQELLLAIALCERILNGKGAVRVHGGGFGGTVQAFVPADLLAEFQTRTEAVLGAGSCHVLSIRPAGGVRLA